MNFPKINPITLATLYLGLVIVWSILLAKVTDSIVIILFIFNIVITMGLFGDKLSEIYKMRA